MCQTEREANPGEQLWGSSVLKSQIEEELEKMTEKDKIFKRMTSQKPRRLRISRKILLTILNAIKRGFIKY